MRLLELVYPFFLKCCEYTDDIFWKFVFEDLAYGKSPYGTYITKNFLCCNYKNKEFSYKIEPDKDPKQLFENIHRLLFYKFGLMSEKDKLSRRKIFENTKNTIEKNCKQDWNNIKKKNIKNIIIENFIIRMKKKYELNNTQSKKLLSIIKVGFIFKNISSSNINYNNGKIISIEGINFEHKKIKIKPEIYNIKNEKKDSQIVIDKKKNMYELWEKLLVNIEKNKIVETI